MQAQTEDNRQVASRIPNLDRGDPITISVNGTPVTAYPGESIAAALLAAGIRILRSTGRSMRRTEPGNAPRGLFCGMGICFDCRVTVNGVPKVRSCLAEVQPGDEVEVPAP